MITDVHHPISFQFQDVCRTISCLSLEGKLGETDVFYARKEDLSIAILKTEYYAIYKLLIPLTGVFVVNIQFSEVGVLVAIVLIPKIDAAERIRKLKPSEYSFDNSLATLLKICESSVHVHGPPITLPNTCPQHSWCGTHDPVCGVYNWLEFRSRNACAVRRHGIELGGGMAVSVTHRGIVESDVVLEEEVHPIGLVVGAPLSIARLATCLWVSSRAVSPCSGACLLFQTHACLIVTHSCFLKKWEFDLTVCGVVPLCICDFDDLTKVDSLAVIASQKVVLIAVDVLESEAYLKSACDFNLSRTQESAISYCRRLRNFDMGAQHAPPFPHLLYWELVVFDDVFVTFMPSKVCSSLSAGVRIGLCANSSCLPDTAYAFFTTPLPHTDRFETTSFIMREYETPSTTLSYHTLRFGDAMGARWDPSQRSTQTRTLGDMALLQKYVTEQTFVRALTACTLGDATRNAFFNLSVKNSLNSDMCSICMHRVSNCILDCGHVLCLSCATKLPFISDHSIGLRTHKQCPMCRNPSRFAACKHPPVNLRARHVARWVKKKLVELERAFVCVCYQYESMHETLLFELSKRKIDTSGTGNVRLIFVSPSATFPLFAEQIVLIWAHMPLFHTPDLAAVNLLRMHASCLVRANGVPSLPVIMMRAWGPEELMITSHFSMITDTAARPLLARPGL
jgi:hypothetical protein